MNKCRILDFNKSTHTVIAIYNNEQIQFVTRKNDVGEMEYIRKSESGYEIIEKPVPSPSPKPSRKNRDNKDCNAAVSVPGAVIKEN